MSVLAVALDLCGDAQGTRAGYQRHWVAKQDPCDPCRAAHRENARAARAKAREAELQRDTAIRAAARAAAAAGLPPCTADPELWFPGLGESNRVQLSICTACPTRQACLDTALDAEGTRDQSMRFGLWGGTTPQQRYQIATGRPGRRGGKARAA